MDRLRSLKNVRYVFPFEMRSSSGSLDYYLVFASQHPVGLKKMKAAMKKMDQNGAYQFSDAHVGKETFFRFDRPEDFAQDLHRHFVGREVSYAAINDFALNETPFIDPKGMLKALELRNRVTVFGRNPTSRRGTFADEMKIVVMFSMEISDG